MRRRLGIGLAALLAAAACSQSSRPIRRRQTTKPTYDKTTGKLTQLTYDRNGNGVIDTWTDMDGAKPLRSRIDQDENGVDRPLGVLRRRGQAAEGRLLAEQTTASRTRGGSRGRTARSRASRFPRPATSRRSIAGSTTTATVLARVELDTNDDGRVDKWETYENGAIKTAEFDEDGDGKRDRRLTYNGAALELIESEPDASGQLHEARGRAMTGSRARLRRRPPRPRRLRHPPPPRAGAEPRDPDRDARAARSPRPGGRELLVQGEPAGVRLPRGRHRRRHLRQLDASGRVHLRQHADPRDRGARGAPVRREEAAVPGKLLHLPARLARSR